MPTIKGHNPLLILGGGLLIIGLLLSQIILPVIASDSQNDAYTDESSADYVITIRFIKDDQIVLNQPMSFFADNVEADKIQVELYYTVSGSDIKIETLEIDIHLSICWDTSDVIILYEDFQTTTDPSGFIIWEWPITELLNPNTNPYNEWNIMFQIDLTGRIYDIWDTQHTSETVLLAACQFTYDGLGFDLTGTISGGGDTDDDGTVTGTGEIGAETSIFSIIGLSTTGGTLNPLENPAITLIFIGMMIVIASVMNNVNKRG